MITPELTTNGAYAKAWRRHPDHCLWLYKLGADGNTESRIEVMCSDRHSQNWGFFYDTETMEILGCHPLFDHNKAFDIEYMRDMDAPYQFGEMTARQAAQTAMEKVDFHFTAPITREDFITDRQYASFQKRAKYLGLQVE